MLEVISIFVLIILILFIICSLILAKAVSNADELDLEFTIGDKTILDIHKHEADDEEEE